MGHCWSLDLSFLVSSYGILRSPYRVASFLKLTEYFFPFFLDLGFIRRVDGMHFGKLVAPVERPARIYNRPRIGEITGGSFLRRDAWIDGAAPTICRNLDGGLRI